jgi:putative membrane protein
MPSRSFLQYVVITAKGLAMGAADVVPGVSGGTIAFIAGVYEELIETIHKLDLGFFKIWKNEGFKAAWNVYNLSFLFALFSGVFISILSLAKAITWLLDEHPILVWSFFFGLVVASILYIGTQIKMWNAKVVVVLVIAAGIAYAITLAKPIGATESTWFLFLAGFVAIIAMILPGISGAFILLLLGAYTSIIGTLSQLWDGFTNFDSAIFFSAFGKLLVFAAGAIVGLKAFSRVLNYMFKYFKNITLAALTGFMIGALNKIWPWKEVLQYRSNHEGKQVPFLENSILPNHFDGDPKVLLAIVFMIIGFLTIFIMERFAASKKES